MVWCVCWAQIFIMSVYSLLGDNLNTEDPRLFWTCLAFCVRRFSRLARDVLHRHAQDGRGGRTNKLLVAVDQVPFIIHKDDTDRRDLLHLCCDGAKLNSKVTHTVCVCVLCVCERVCRLTHFVTVTVMALTTKEREKQLPNPNAGKRKQLVSICFCITSKSVNEKELLYTH